MQKEKGGIAGRGTGGVLARGCSAGRRVGRARKKPRIPPLSQPAFSTGASSVLMTLDEPNFPRHVAGPVTPSPFPFCS